MQSELENETDIHYIATRRVGSRATTDYQARFKVNKTSNLFQFVDSINILLEARGLWDMPGTDERGTSSFAENLRAKVEGLKIEHGDSLAKKFVTISLGVFTCYPDQKTTAGLVIENADKALYKTKN